MLRIGITLLLFSFSVTANEYWESLFQKTEEARRRTQQIQQPIDAPKSSDFGLRFHPILNVDKLHRGVDFAAPEGTPFNAAGSGVVLYAEERGDLGLTIAIQHSNGYITRYGHASKALVIAGDIVDKHTQIGLVGDTGTATAPHIHFELIVDGEHVDPTEITTFYNLNEELSTLDDRINALLSSQQKSTLETVSQKQQPAPHAEPDKVLSVSHEKPNDNTELSPEEKLPNTTWGIAQRLIAGTDFTVFQALSALLEANPKSFKAGNMHFRYADRPLKLPSHELIAKQSHEEARALYYTQLSPKLPEVSPESLAQTTESAPN